MGLVVLVYTQINVGYLTNSYLENANNTCSDDACLFRPLLFSTFSFCYLQFPLFAQAPAGVGQRADEQRYN